jgi:hypothetical protein
LKCRDGPGDRKTEANAYLVPEGSSEYSLNDVIFKIYKFFRFFDFIVENFFLHSL